MKFSLSTPSHASFALNRVLNGFPSSVRIKQDVEKLTLNVHSIVEAKGCVAPGLGSGGKRRGSEYEKSMRWGGKRVRSTKAAVEHCIHEIAVECTETAIKEAVLKVNTKIKHDLKDEKKEVCTRTPKNEVKENHLSIRKMSNVRFNAHTCFYSPDIFSSAHPPTMFLKFHHND